MHKYYKRSLPLNMPTYDQNQFCVSTPVPGTCIKDLPGPSFAEHATASLHVYRQFNMT